MKQVQTMIALGRQAARAATLRPMASRPTPLQLTTPPAATSRMAMPRPLLTRPLLPRLLLVGTGLGVAAATAMVTGCRDDGPDLAGALRATPVETAGIRAVASGPAGTAAAPVRHAVGPNLRGSGSPQRFAPPAPVGPASGGPVLQGAGPGGSAIASAPASRRAWPFGLSEDRRRRAGRVAAAPVRLAYAIAPQEVRRPSLAIPLAAGPARPPRAVERREEPAFDPQPETVPEIARDIAPEVAYAPAEDTVPPAIEAAIPAPRIAVPSVRPRHEARDEAPVRVASLNPREPLRTHNPRPRRGGGPLAGFHAKLAALRNGRRTRPVTILHIGDSHVASDSFTRGIRKRLQATYGNAGRGAVIPPKAFPYAAAAQVSMKRTGKWSAAYSLKHKSGPYGVSGVRISSSSRRAALTMTSKTGAFDFVEVMMLTGPKAGGVTIQAGGKKKTFSARASRRGSKLVRLAARAKTAVVRPAGRGRTTILHWSTGRDRPGVRYVNFGLVGATVNVTKRWDKQLVANDIRALKPDLIVYGYGTNEGFNANVNLDSYRAYATAFVKRLQRAAPDADIAFIGAADGATRRSRSGSGCRGGYRTPVKLGGVRRTVKSMAKELGAGYWDWAGAMGGRCSVDKWARKGLAAKDRVHLTGKGYDRSASMFVSQLLAPSSRSTSTASAKR